MWSLSVTHLAGSTMGTMPKPYKHIPLQTMFDGIKDMGKVNFTISRTCSSSSTYQRT